MSDRRTGVPACPVRSGCKVDRQGRLSSCLYYNASFFCNKALVHSKHREDSVALIKMRFSISLRMTLRRSSPDNNNDIHLKMIILTVGLIEKVLDLLTDGKADEGVRLAMV